VFEGEWDDARKVLVAARPMKDHPFTQGFFCQKYTNRSAYLYHPDRLQHPLVRNGPKGSNAFKETDSETAWQMLVTKTREIKDEHGPKAILGAYYSGNTGLISGDYSRRFFGALGGAITTGGICNEGGIAGLKELFGTYSTTNPFQLNDPETRLIVVWGSDLAGHNIHARQLVSKARHRGAKLAVIDTRRTATASEADLFIHATPGTEGMIALLALKQLLTGEMQDAEFITTHVDIDGDLVGKLREIDDDAMLSSIYVTRDEIDALVAMLAEYQHHTIFDIGYGTQKYTFGGEAVKSIALLQIFLGNISKPGCGIVYSQSGLRRDIVNDISRYITANERMDNAKEVSLIELASALESGEFKMLVIYNFNPASSLPDQEQLRAQLVRDDLFVVVHDLFLNATTRYADIVFPAKASVETNDLFWSFYIPGISITRSGPCPYPECMSNIEFFQRFAQSLGLDEEEFQDLFTENDSSIVNQCLSIVGPEVQQDVLTRGYHLFVNQDTVPFDDLQFPTPNHRIQVTVPNISVSHLFDRKPGEFFLITPQHERFIHSQLGEINQDHAGDFDAVYLHPDDIAMIGADDGCIVEVSSGASNIPYTLLADSHLKPGTALLYSGGLSADNGKRNANFFTPGTPEALGHSGSYNSGKIMINRV